MSIEFLPYWLRAVCYCCACLVPAFLRRKPYHMDRFVTYIGCLPLNLYYISLQGNSFSTYSCDDRSHLTALRAGLTPSPLLNPLLPDGIVGGTEVDEEIPAPVPHGQQVSHTAKIHGQQTCTTPDGGHAPWCHPHIGILRSQGMHLPV